MGYYVDKFENEKCERDIQRSKDNIERIKKRIYNLEHNINNEETDELENQDIEKESCDHDYRLDDIWERSTCEGVEDIEDEWDDNYYWIEKEYICIKCGKTYTENEY